ncbi:hypothetical protein A1O7_08306 [Cladophialophora yegresii CBS 114405]|uniref:ML-like domain-containing protein n=1 Tax=Cladophialophora yegresii CBS 114405 TaxID=1182544 RepID=W9WA03_9EURO|nr:uncharacterized protein A1O7_08306 [Cladophialophora yegresii CBS 114405]EXJ55379.1 hypothetical protein A1O7_08306 [Cladophialophora yegresii CBS 114405]
MSRTHPSRLPFTAIGPLFLILFSLLTISTALSVPTESHFHFLATRQTNTNTNLSDPLCLQYSTIANLSIVGSNATYRSAYLQASPAGGDPARAPLDSAMLELPNWQFNKTVNDACGNLTTVAFESAATNFTNGVVLQFKIGAVNAASAVQVGGSVLGMGLIVGLVALGLLI